MKDILLKKYSCSPEYMDSLLSAVDVTGITATCDADIKLQIIDPPVVNGVNLLNHPNDYQRKKYSTHLKNGGKVAGIYDKEVFCGITLVNSADINTGLNNTKVRKSMVDGKARGIVQAAIDTNFTVGGKGRNVLKNPKGKDLWYLLDAKERQDILTSTDTEVMAIVSAVDSDKNLKVGGKVFKGYLDTLMLKGLLSQRTYKELKDNK